MANAKNARNARVVGGLLADMQGHCGRLKARVVPLLGETGALGKPFADRWCRPG